MKRVMLLFLGAIFSFMLLSYIDEYESLIVPYLGEADGYSDLVESEINEKGIELFLRSFNEALTELYLTSDPSSISGLSASKEIKKAIYDEILFLRNRDRVMDLRLLDLSILRVDKLSPFALRVRVRESSQVRYGSGGNIPTSATYTEEEYEIIYTLSVIAEGFEVAGLEIVPMGNLVKQAD